MPNVKPVTVMQILKITMFVKVGIMARATPLTVIATARNSRGCTFEKTKSGINEPTITAMDRILIAV